MLRPSPLPAPVTTTIRSVKSSMSPTAGTDTGWELGRTLLGSRHRSPPSNLESNQSQQGGGVWYGAGQLRGEVALQVEPHGVGKGEEHACCQHANWMSLTEHHGDHGDPTATRAHVFGKKTQ